MARSHKRIVIRIRQAVLDGRYVVTPHAWMEMRNDRLTLPDIESALLRGIIEQEYTDDPRGTRYLVVGEASDLSTRIAVVVRFIRQDDLLIITVFLAPNGHR